MAPSSDGDELRRRLERYANEGMNLLALGHAGTQSGEVWARIRFSVGGGGSR